MRIAVQIGAAGQRVTSTRSPVRPARLVPPDAGGGHRPGNNGQPGSNGTSGGGNRRR